jgi:hypothetical protein
MDMGCDVDGGALVQQVLGSSAWRERVETHLARINVPETHGPLEL